MRLYCDGFAASPELDVDTFIADRDPANIESLDVVRKLGPLDQQLTTARIDLHAEHSLQSSSGRRIPK